MFKPYHDITTQAVRARARVILSLLLLFEQTLHAQVDAEGNVLEGLYDKDGVLQRDKAFVLTRT
jgi:hypothetical protein